VAILVLPSITYIIVAFFSIPTAERRDLMNALFEAVEGIRQK